MLSLRSNSKQSYRLHGKLHGHSGAIVRLQATEDGNFLASGGTDGTKAWDLHSMRENPGPTWLETHGATTAIVWVKREDNMTLALVYGTQNSQLVCWQGVKREGKLVFEEVFIAAPLIKSAEITGLAFDASSNRLAVCHRGGVIQLYTVEDSMTLKYVWSQEFKNYVPRAVAFSQLEGDERSVLVFPLYGGYIHTLKANKGTVADSPWHISANIGDVAVNAQKGLVCVDEPSSGANLYALSNPHVRTTFPVDTTPGKNRRLRQVALDKDCTTIVSGSDHGVVHVFDRRSQGVEKLRVDAHEWVQTVTVSCVNGARAVFAAKSRDIGRSNEIFVWRKKHTKIPVNPVTLFCAALIAIQLVLMIAVVVVVYEEAIFPIFNLKFRM
ncbi:WD40-repeat-containing domain protein [Favolaschia claudopus]|uniref:WD40-repeat-containing domain protein n=1 Tax=Favolaschia claudopus TaxID=2862362 RepID=A0AAW0C5R4_9AGAR